MVVSAANSAARKRPRTSEQGPRAVEDQAVQSAPRPGGPDSDEHGSELRANADSTSKGLASVDLDEADVDSDADFDDLDADDTVRVARRIARRVVHTVAGRGPRGAR